MLIRFAVKNHRSLRDAQELSLVASSMADSREGLVNFEGVPGGGLLPCVMIYGANAAGKSNILSAIWFMRGAVMRSHNRSNPEDEIPLQPFLLDPKSTTASSSYDIDFVVSGTHYHYGFDANLSAFTAEWLYSFPKNRRQMLFSRKNQKFVFGRKLKGRNHVISELTRRNSLFLAAAAQNGHPELSKVAGFFESFRDGGSISVSSSRASSALSKSEIDHRVIAFLAATGTGVVGFRKSKREATKEGAEFRAQLRAIIERYINSPMPLEIEDTPQIELAHKSCDGKEVYFRMEQESAGTRRLLILLDQTFRALDGGTVLLADEINASLHTHAADAVLELFSSRKTNPNGAQLVATTHDTNLLNSDLLRRDQVWFTEKDAGGATHLYPLSDIRTRKGDNLEKGYLQGRYGAIPLPFGIAEALVRKK